MIPSPLIYKNKVIASRGNFFTLFSQKMTHVTVIFCVCVSSSFSIVIWGILTQKKPYQGKAKEVITFLYEKDRCWLFYQLLATVFKACT